MAAAQALAGGGTLAGGEGGNESGTVVPGTSGGKGAKVTCTVGDRERERERRAQLEHPVRKALWLSTTALGNLNLWRAWAYYGPHAPLFCALIFF